MRCRLTTISLRACIAAPAAILLAAMLCSQQPAAASQPSETQLASYEAGSETERVKLLLHLAKNGKHDQAEWLLQKYPLQGPHAANRKFYIDGLVLKARRDYTGAVGKFRSALADDPKLTMVRAELAQTLVILQQDDSALHHLRQLATDAPSDEEARGIKSFIDQVDARSPFKFNAWIAAAPTSNINNGISKKKVYDANEEGFDPGESRKQSKAVGMAAGVNAAFSRRLGNDFTLVAGINHETRLYDNADYNSFSFSESVELRYLLERGHIGIGAVSSQSIDKETVRPNFVSYGPRVSLHYGIDQKNTVTLTGVYEWRDSINDLADGNALFLDASLTHGFTSGFSVTALAGYDKVTSQLGFSSFQTWTGGLSVYKELPMGITASVAAQLRYSEFDAPQGILGLREDWRTSGNLTLTKRDLNILGFAPSLNYSYSLNQSSIFLYDYDNHAIDLRFTKDF